MRKCCQRPGLGGGEMGEGAQKVKTFSYEIIKFWGCNVQHVMGVKNTAMCI